MMRAEVAVCLLAEVAYEHDEDFRGHLPLLFHAMLLLMDSTDSLVFRHAQQVVTHLLYSLSVRHLEIHRAAGISPIQSNLTPSTAKPESSSGTSLSNQEWHDGYQPCPGKTSLLDIPQTARVLYLDCASIATAHLYWFGTTARLTAVWKVQYGT